MLQSAAIAELPDAGWIGLCRDTVCAIATCGAAAGRAAPLQARREVFRCRGLWGPHPLDASPCCRSRRSGTDHSTVNVLISAQ